MRRFLLAVLIALGPVAAVAKEAPALAQDPKTEQRLMALAEELRCLVCQNESLAASRAELAMDLKREIRLMIQAGKSDAEIRDYLVKRYGDFVLYRPPLKARTVLLWAGPFLLLALGAFLAWRRVTRRRAPEAELSPAERERAAKLLE